MKIINVFFIQEKSTGNYWTRLKVSVLIYFFFFIGSQFYLAKTFSTRKCKWISIMQTITLNPTKAKTSKWACIWQDLCCVSTDRGSKSDEGETPQELKEEKLSLESSFPGSPPKCSTPRRQSPARQNLKSPLTMFTRLLQVPVTTPRNLLDLYRQFLRY